MNQTITESEVINLSEACAILGIAIGYGYQIYEQWRDYGVRILRRTDNAHPRFYRRDIFRMLERRK